MPIQPGQRLPQANLKVEDGMVRSLDIDPPKTFEHSSAEAVLARL